MRGPELTTTAQDTSPIATHIAMHRHPPMEMLQRDGGGYRGGKGGSRGCREEDENVFSPVHASSLSSAFRAELCRSI